MKYSPGRLFYIFLFRIQSLYARLTIGRNFEAWYRNSLLQNYFSFGRSDIDVSIDLKTDDNIFFRSQLLSSTFKYCPLIKEINFYYPFSLKLMPQTANMFELAKDKTLSKQVGAYLGHREAQAFVYLWRMYFSNLNKKELSKRDLSKWKFHFTLTGNETLFPELLSEPTKKNLLAIIFKKFNMLEMLPSALYAVECFWENKPLFDQIRECSEPTSLYCLLPQQFCFIENPFNLNDRQKEEILIEQLSWEISGMMAQPVLFKNQGSGFAHLKNIQRTLHGLKFTNSENESRRLELKMITDSYLIFLSPDHP